MVDEIEKMKAKKDFKNMKMFEDLNKVIKDLNKIAHVETKNQTLKTY